MNNTVLDAMILCGVNNTTLFENQTKAARFADEIFGNDFHMCMDKTFEELQSDLKSYASLPVTQGQIRTSPGIKQRIQAFIQWTRDKIRNGEDPSAEPFPVHRTSELIRNYKSHQAFIEKSKTLIDTAKPSKFKDTYKWEDWCPTFLNFLRSIPGRNGVPLSYVCRTNDFPLPPDPNTDFMDNYVTRAPLTGDAFKVDAAEVHTYLVNFMAGNNTAEVKMLPYMDSHNGRLDFKALKDHYEGVGVNAVNILKAEETIRNLFYSGEKKPHMWWEEFEKRLTHAFTVFDKKEKRKVYSDEMKLRMLTQKINADFLQHTKASINIELTRIPVTMTYQQALMSFRNEVNRKFPPDMSTNNTRTRRVNEVMRGGRAGRYGGRGGRFSQRGGRGRGPYGRGGRTGRGPGRGHPDARYITGIDGRTIEVHPAYNFPPAVWNNLPYIERKRITQERNDYRSSKRQKVSTTETTTSTINGVPSASNTIISNVSTDNTAAQIPNSIMGGRNEQHSLRSRNPGNPGN